MEDLLANEEDGQAISGLEPNLRRGTAIEPCTTVEGVSTAVVILTETDIPWIAAVLLTLCLY